MNQSLRKRIERLQVIARPMDLATLDDEGRRWYLGLCEPCRIRALQRIADYTAERRHHHERGRQSPWVGDWLETTTAAERDAAWRVEVERYLATDPDDPAQLDAWLETADREGWPPLRGLIFPMNRTGLDDMVQHDRSSIDQSRGSSMPIAIMWRSKHQDWRRGMTGDEALAFEVALDIEAHRLDDEWFPAHQGAA